MSAHLGAWVLGLVMGVRGVAGGYLSLNMTPATQCGVSTVQWSGDDGPYHLLLTPTQHVQHGYNVWLPSIPADTNTYNLSINQPAGSHFLLTMWGASGISFAGTTDVNTVGAPRPGASDSCFLSDAAILALYSFSFNITDEGNSFPPQCSELALSWPTSLDQNVTGFESATADSASDDNDGETPSSSKHQGNTTYPPTLFGIIPLGNSFSVPITYADNSSWANSLPPESLSDNPTTFTSNGVTSLNWTIDMARGTRFILVAGIGSNSQWASGGSSELMTVGQGSTGCVGSEQHGGNGPPKVTATGSSTDSSPTSTSPSDQESNPPASTKKSSSVARTVIACVISVLGTLIVIGLLVICCRVRRKRREAALNPDGGSGSPHKLGRAGLSNTTSTSADSHYPIDLVSLQDRGEVPQYTPIAGPSSPIRTSPVTPRQNTNRGPLRPALSIDPIATPIRGFEPGTMTTGTYSSPISPHGTNILAGASAESSQDALLQKSNLQSPVRTSSSPAFPPSRRSTALQLHNRENSLSVEDEGEEMADLKMETIAAVDGRPQADSGTPTPESRRRRPRDDGQETEYVVHRDAGRVQGARPEASRRRVELPPRYDQLHWEEGEGREEPENTR